VYNKLGKNTEEKWRRQNWRRGH